MTKEETYQEFWCPYCKLWLTDIIHRENHHNDIDEVDEKRVDTYRTVVEHSGEGDLGKWCVSCEKHTFQCECLYGKAAPIFV